MAPRFQFTVYGVPAGQGNLKTGRHGKNYHENGKELREWRGKVRQAALDHTGAHEWEAAGKNPCIWCGVLRKLHGELLGPVRLEAVVTVARPKSVTADWPVTRSASDWDHYARAIGDALTGVTYADDAQIVDGHVVVTYPLIHPDALHQPGAVIKIWEV